MKLAKNFTSDEFACRCGCGASAVKPGLVTGLQALRDVVAKPVVILSGVRCQRHNASVGGAKSSYHLTGQAADITVVGMKTAELHRIAKTVPDYRGFGLGANFLHVDVRSKPATWAYDRNGKVIAA